MDLLPKHCSEFSTDKFWENFFKSRGSKSFEWYGDYTTFCSYIAQYIKPSDRILVIGCGNSELSASMYNVGYKNIINIDNNLSVIQKMNKKFSTTKPEMTFVQMDVTDLKYQDGEFAVVLDKGTLDAIFSENTESCSKSVTKMFDEIERVLKFSGRYICITLAQPYIAKHTLHHFEELGWFVRVSRVNAASTDDSNSFHLPVFVFIFTKFKKMATSHQIVEISYFENKLERLTSISELLAAIEDLQKYAIIKEQLNNRELLDKEISLDIFDATTKTARYKIFIVDGTKTGKKKFAIFIVPQGRELEWMFATEIGRKDLHSRCGFQRLLVVLLDRSHQFNNLDQVKSELSSMVLELAPSNVQKQSPFLTIGETICVKTVVHKGKSDGSGEFVVEDVDVDGEMRRRLIFLRNPNLIQSEVTLVPARKKNKKSDKTESYVCSFIHLPSVYHVAFISAIVFTKNFLQIINSEINLLIVGLGAGNLPMFFKEFLKMVRVDCLEIDEDVVKIANTFFGFEANDKIACFLGDGIQLINEFCSKDKRYDVLYIDVDNKDVSQGLTCPPRQFLETQFLQNCICLLQNTGLLVLNVACRSKDMHSMVVNKLKQNFTQVFSLDFPQDTNEVVFCMQPCRPHLQNSIPIQTLSSLEVNETVVNADFNACDLQSLTHDLAITNMADSETFKTKDSRHVEKYDENHEHDCDLKLLKSPMAINTDDCLGDNQLSGIKDFCLHDYKATLNERWKELLLKIQNETIPDQLTSFNFNDLQKL